MLRKFHVFLKRLFGENTPILDITLVFDKGNNSLDNFALIDSMPLNFVGFVKYNLISLFSVRGLNHLKNYLVATLDIIKKKECYE